MFLKHATLFFPLLALLFHQKEFVLDYLANKDTVGGSYDPKNLYSLYGQKSGLFMVGDNIHGALGFGSRTPYLARHPIPTQLPDAGNITSIALGMEHSAIQIGDNVYLFGDNYYGQLGFPRPYYNTVPTLVVSPNGKSIEKFALGHYSTAIIAGGELYVCGYVRYEYHWMYLGLGSQRTFMNVPAPNQKLVTAVGMGEWHFAFVAGGELFTWGYNYNGELGLDFVSASAYPIPVASPNGEPITSLTLGARFTVFKAGREHFGFGENYYGQITSRKYKVFRPVELKLPGDLPIDALATGDRHMLLLSGGRMFVQGLNDECQLGTGKKNCNWLVEEVTSPNGQPIDKVFAGLRRSAFMAGGELFVMGLNRDAEMGLGGGNHMSDNFCSPFSYPVSAGFRIADFALGGKHTALLTVAA